MHNTNYKSRILDTYLKHDDLQDRYTKLHQELRQPNGHIPFRQPPSYFPVIASENKSFSTTNYGRKFMSWVMASRECQFSEKIPYQERNMFKL